MEGGCPKEVSVEWLAGSLSAFRDVCRRLPEQGLGCARCAMPSEQCLLCLPASTWRCLPKNRRHRHRLPVPCGWNAAWILSYFVESKTQLTLNISAIWCEWSMIVTFWTMNGLKTLVLLLMDIYLKAHFVFEVLVGGCGWLCKSSGVFRTGTINARRVPREIDISWRGGLSQKRV